MGWRTCTRAVSPWCTLFWRSSVASWVKVRDHLGAIGLATYFRFRAFIKEMHNSYLRFYKYTFKSSPEGTVTRFYADFVPFVSYISYNIPISLTLGNFHYNEYKTNGIHSGVLTEHNQFRKVPFQLVPLGIKPVAHRWNRRTAAVLKFYIARTLATCIIVKNTIRRPSAVLITAETVLRIVTSNLTRDLTFQ